MQVRAERGEESWAACAGPRGCASGPQAGTAARERALAKNWAGMVLVLGCAARWEWPRWRRRARGLREGDADKRGPLVSRTGTNAAEPEQELLRSGVTRAAMLG